MGVLNTGKAYTLEAREFGARAKVGAVAGNWSTSVTFGPIIKEDFTICSISRYTGKFKNRILQGSYVDDISKGNWVHGHWADRAAVAYYESWKTSRDNKLKKITDWLIMCGQNDEHPILHANGLDVANHRIRQHQYNVNINCCGCCHKEGSDWAVAEIMTWDRHLSLKELEKVERYLKRILAEGIDFQEQSAKWDCELDLTTFSGQNVLEKNLNWYVGKDEEHMMVDFKSQQDDLTAKDLQEKTQKQKLNQKLAKGEAEFEAEELERKKRKVELLAAENKRKKIEILEKQKAILQTKANGGVNPAKLKPPTPIIKKLSFPGDFDKTVSGKKALFLQECSKAMSPVSCSDVQKGSIIVTLKSSSPSAMASVVKDVTTKGLKMDSFILLPGKVVLTDAEQSDKDEEDSESCEGCDVDDKEFKKKQEEKAKEAADKKKEAKADDRSQTKEEAKEKPKKPTSTEKKKEASKENEEKKDEEEREEEKKKIESEKKEEEEKKQEEEKKEVTNEKSAIEKKKDDLKKELEKVREKLKEVKEQKKEEAKDEERKESKKEEDKKEEFKTAD